MPLKWQPLNPAVYRDWVDAIIAEASDELTDWEKNFIDSIDRQLTLKRELSERQAEVLERIYANKTK